MINPFTGLEDNSYVVLREHPNSKYYWDGLKFVRGYKEAKTFDNFIDAEAEIRTMTSIWMNRYGKAPDMIAQIILSK
jgi:hypothetical protein